MSTGLLDPKSDQDESEGFSSGAIRGQEEHAATGGAVRPSIDSVGVKHEGGLAPSLTSKIPKKDIGDKMKSSDADTMRGLFKDEAAKFGAENPLAKHVNDKIQEKIKGFVGDHKKGIGAGGGIAAALATLLLLFGSVAITNELAVIISSIESHFFASSSQDVEKETDKLIDSYIKRRIIKRMGPECKDSSDLSEECMKEDTSTAEEAADDPVDDLFNAWDEANMPQKLADAGFKFTYEDDGTHLHTPSGADINVSKYADSNDSILDDPAMSAEDVDAWTSVISQLEPTTGTEENQTLEPELDEATGADECFQECSTPEDAEAQEATETPTQEAALDDAEIAAPAMDEAATVSTDGVSCILAGAECDTTDNNAVDETGSLEDGLESQVSEDSEKLATTLGSEKLASLIASANELKTKATGALVQAVADNLAELASSVTGTEIASETVSDIMEKIAGEIAGPVQWIQIFAQALYSLATLGTKLRIINFLVHEAPTILIFAKDAAALAEQKAGGGGVNLTAFGSVIKSFSANGSNATQSQWFQSVSDPNNTPSDVNSGSISKELKNENLNVSGYGNGLTAASDGFDDIPGSGLVTQAAKYASDIINGAFGPLTWLIGSITNITGLNHLIAKAAGAFMKFLINNLVHIPNFTTMGGKTAADTTMEGADFSGNKLAEANGGEQLSPTQSSIVTETQEKQAMQQFQQLPVFARVFSTDTPYSLVSKLSLDLPLSFGSAFQDTMADLVSNPFDRVFQSFSTIFTSSIAHAAATAQADPAGITQYGFPNSAAVFSSDPQTYWQQNDCTQQEAQNWPKWNSAANTSIDSQTGQEVHNTANGCLLIVQTTKAAKDIAGDTST